MTTVRRRARGGAPHEHCELCLLAAPRWSMRSYQSWHLLIAPHGELLGVICPRCAADPAVWLELLAGG